MIIDINIIKTYQFKTQSKDDIMIISSLKQQKIFWVTLDGATGRPYKLTVDDNH